MFAGDLVFEGRAPALISANIPQWIDVLRNLRKLPIQSVVPGHGQAGGTELLDAQVGWLTRFYQEARSMKDRPIDQIVAAVVKDNDTPERYVRYMPLVIRKIVSED